MIKKPRADAIMPPTTTTRIVSVPYSDSLQDMHTWLIERLGNPAYDGHDMKTQEGTMAKWAPHGGDYPTTFEFKFCNVSDEEILLFVLTWG